MYADLPVAQLVAAASGGEKGAWDALVTRYAGLVVAVARRYRLSHADVADVSQTVWLRVVERLDDLRDPQALPAWLVTTTQHECLKVTRRADRQVLGAVVDDTPADAAGHLGAHVGGDAYADVDEEIAQAQRRAALREAYAELPLRDRELLGLLTVDPPLPYAEISRRLAIPIGSIGPRRARCIERLRRSPALAPLLQDPPGATQPGATPRKGGRR